MRRSCSTPPTRNLLRSGLLPAYLATLCPTLAVITWQYNNHAVRSLNFRYIRYRDGTEELYDHRTDPNEHHNLAGEPDLASIKEKLAAWIPTRNVMPESLKIGGLDSYGRKYQRLRDEGVPDWLGHIPPISTE